MKGGIDISLPVIAPFKTFDAVKDYAITFSWDGLQAYGNEIKIIKNDSGETIYNNKVTSFLLQHIVPANTLGNAVQYSVQLRIIDKDGNNSEWSNPLIFTTHLTPTININLTNNQLIQASNYDVNVSYESADGEKLNTWVLFFYDNSGNLIYNTDIQYAATTMAYKLTALESSTEYKIKVVGNTVDDVTISTETITFQVQYTRLSIYYNVELENIFDKGQIRVASNLISIDGKAIPDPPIYINNKEIDLSQCVSWNYYGNDLSNVYANYYQTVNYILNDTGEYFVNYVFDKPILLSSNTTCIVEMDQVALKIEATLENDTVYSLYTGDTSSSSSDDKRNLILNIPKSKIKSLRFEVHTLEGDATSLGDIIFNIDLGGYSFILNDKGSFAEYILFDDGFNITNGHSLQLLFRNLVPYQTLCESSNGIDSIKLKYMQAVFDSNAGYKGYFLLEVSNGGYLPYRIASEPFELLMDQYVCVIIKRIDNLYSLNILDGNLTVGEWNDFGFSIDEWNAKKFSNDQFRMSGKMLLRGVII